MFYSLWCGGTKHNYPLTCFARQAGRQVLHSPSSSNPRLHDWPLPAQGPAPMSGSVSISNRQQQQQAAGTAGSSMPAASGAGASEY